MKPKITTLLLLQAMAASAADYPYQPVPFTDVHLTGGLIQQRQKVNNEVTLPFAVEQCVTSKRLENFDLAADTMKRRAEGDTHFQHMPVTQYPFDDSDIYKVAEGAAFCLSVEKNPAIQSRIDDFIQHVKAAQEPDGYLYTWRTMHPDSPPHDWVGQQRWEKDPILSHELYNLGHLYEAATAYYQATGSRVLLDVAEKSAELLYKEFGDGKKIVAPGHEVVEMGLAKLYRQTGDKRWLDLAKLFLDARGHGSDYSQDHMPVVKQTTAVGHAVRANYLYSGMADVAALTGDESYLKAINQIWENVVSRKLHLTGGCGALAAGEAYGKDYELPNNCYNETCAAVAFLFWNQRMFLMTGDSKYMDVFERTLYNGTFSGVSLSGDRFFYPNTLEYDGKAKNNHGYAGRAPWFGCACCPPNIMRTIASIGGYFYAVKNSDLYVNLYAQGDATASIEGKKIKLTQQTNYPWDGAIQVKVETDAPQTFTMHLRIPGWIEGHPLPSDLYTYDDATPAKWTASLNGKPVSLEKTKGYLTLQREWKSGDTVTLNLPMPVRRVAGNPKINATKGMVALERGPVVYAFEGIDNDKSIFDLSIPAKAEFKAGYQPDFLGGVVTVKVENAERTARDSEGKISVTPVSLTAIPYATWNNRGLSQMAVWIPRDPTKARPAPKETKTSNAKVTTSFTRDGMSISPLNDQLMPQNATDGFAPNFDFWPHKGTHEWISYEFQKLETISSVITSWFDDTGVGDCRLPKSWRVLYLDSAGQWQPVKNPSDYGIQRRNPVKVTFTPVTTTALKLEVELPDGFSSGLYEWGAD
jgi:uncharacterized protein